MDPVFKVKKWILPVSEPFVRYKINLTRTNIKLRSVCVYVKMSKIYLKSVKYEIWV